MTRPKGVRVKVERFPEGRIESGLYKLGDPIRLLDEREALALGVPPLKPGESVTGRMVFVPDKKKAKR